MDVILWGDWTNWICRFVYTRRWNFFSLFFSLSTSSFLINWLPKTSIIFFTSQAPYHRVIWSSSVQPPSLILTILIHIPFSTVRFRNIHLNPSCSTLFWLIWTIFNDGPFAVPTSQVSLAWILIVIQNIQKTRSRRPGALSRLLVSSHYSGDQKSS